MKKLKALYSRFNQSCFQKSCTLAALLVTVPGLKCFAMNGLSNATVGNNIKIETGGTSIEDWPWTKFLNSLAEQLTGPLPMILGVLGLAVAAIGMFMGNHGQGMQKALVLVFAVSICLFAPSFIKFIAEGVGTQGLTIFAGM